MENSLIDLCDDFLNIKPIIINIKNEISIVILVVFK